MEDSTLKIMEEIGVVHGNDTIPSEIRLPCIHSGVDYTEYDSKVIDAHRNDLVLFETLFKEHVAKFNNISGSIIHFPSGDKHVYRSAMLAFSPETIEELVIERGVKTIIHLSNSNVVDQALWTQTEKDHFFELGGQPENYIHILDFDYTFKNEEELYEGQLKVAEIIHLIEENEGHVLIHCLGGEHKTEIIFEVMQKVYNHLEMENIEQRYKAHTGWTPDPNKTSGYKQCNIDFIRDFPESLLWPPSEPKPAASNWSWIMVLSDQVKLLLCKFLILLKALFLLPYRLYSGDLQQNAINSTSSCPEEPAYTL